MKKYILGLLALAFMPMATWAQDEPEPEPTEPVIVAINETNFPDANFRAVVETFNTDGEEGLSEAEIAAATTDPKIVNKMDLSGKGISNLKGLEFFTATRILLLQENSFNSIDLSALTELRDLRIAQSAPQAGGTKLESLDISNNTKLITLYCAYIGLKSLDVSNNLELEDLQCNNNELTSINVDVNEKLEYLHVEYNKIGTLNVSNNKKLLILQCTDCGLSELDVTNNTNLYRLYCDENDISVLDVSKMSNNTHHNTALRCNDNPIKELDVSMLEGLREFDCSDCELTTLDLTNNPILDNFACSGNHLTTLDLSKNDKLTKAQVSGQTKEVDAIVIDREKIAIEVIPTNDNTVLSGDLFSDLSGSVANDGDKEYVEIDGKCYLVIAKPTDNKDVDLYEKAVKYNFNTKCTSEKEKDVPMSVTITTYPYIMYVNPYSKDLNDGFYSGTLIVDYDAVVPKGAEAYIATKVLLDSETMIMDGDKVTFDQLQMTKVGNAGDVIPANTPIYVKSATETGLFAFARNLEEKELVTIPDGNIFEGTLEDKNVTPGEVLTLGREDKQGTGAVGFWAFLGSYVPAHRVFIDSAILSEIDGANGFTLNFDGAADGINTISTTTADGAYYTLQGIKVSEPTQKGVYIHNGKKIMVK